MNQSEYNPKKTIELFFSLFSKKIPIKFLPINFYVPPRQSKKKKRAKILKKKNSFPIKALFLGQNKNK